MFFQFSEQSLNLTIKCFGFIHRTQKSIFSLVRRASFDSAEQATRPAKLWQRRIRGDAHRVGRGQSRQQISKIRRIHRDPSGGH